MAEPEIRIEDESGETRLAGSLLAPSNTPAGRVPTTTTGGKTAWQVGGGGGGVQVATVPVSSAEVLDLKNTSKVLVPGVAGSMIYPLAEAVIVYIAGATPYTDHGGYLNFDIGQSTTFYSVQGAGFWDQASSQVYPLSPGQVTIAAPDPPVNYDGFGVLLSADNNPTGGDGTLLVTVAYVVAPLV